MRHLLNDWLFEQFSRNKEEEMVRESGKCLFLKLWCFTLARDGFHHSLIIRLISTTEKETLTKKRFKYIMVKECRKQAPVKISFIPVGSPQFCHVMISVMEVSVEY